MGGPNFRDAYEFDPEAYGSEGAGGLLGRLQAIVRQGGAPPAVDFGSTPSGTPEYGPETSFSPQGGLLGRMLSLQAQQSRYQPVAANSGREPFASQDPNFRQLVRLPNGAPLPMLGASEPLAEASAAQTQA